MTQAIPSGQDGPSLSAPALEMAHVLFMDVVSYSLLPMDQQQKVLSDLQQAVQKTAQLGCDHPRDDLICLPTGDGMALVFFGCPEAPVTCAVELTRALRQHPEIKLRMGIHTGPVYRVADINQARNVTGGGINMAQRVMDCGDAGHILVSKAVADTLVQLSAWNNVVLRDLGEVEVKHGVQVHIFNLYSDDVGNSDLPRKLRTQRQTAISRRTWWGIACGILIVAGLMAGGLYYRSRQASRLTEKDTIVLADFNNKTGDPVFDDTLKTALTIALQQSPFLNVLSDDRIASTLKLMMRPVDTKLTPEVARELCLRAGSRVSVTGSITSLGSQYALWLKAVNCRSGETLAQEQATADRKESVLNALGKAAAGIRNRLGESLSSVQRFDVPLEEATTSSLEALQAYSLGMKATYASSYQAALPYFLHATEIDPHFAMGYRAVGGAYYDIGQLGRASQYYTRAFQLRERTSEREKLIIAAEYYDIVTGELQKTIGTCEEIVGSYPRDHAAYIRLGIAYGDLGQYEKAIAVTREAQRTAPDRLDSYADLVNYLVALGRFEEARQTIRNAQLKKMDSLLLHLALYGMGFVSRDTNGLLAEKQWFANTPQFASYGLALESDTAAYAGRLEAARELTRRSVEEAVGSDNKETAAITWENAALREAALGNFVQAREAADAGLSLNPETQGVKAEAGLAYAMVGDTARAKSLADELNKQYPLNTQIQSVWLPAIQAQLALGNNDPGDAIQALQNALPPIEFGEIPFIANITCLYPTYIRGQAYLAAGQGAAAAAEFGKITERGGMVWNCWTGALAQLGVARANAMQAKASRKVDADAARVRARAAYQRFLDLWRGPGEDLPIYHLAKAEYAQIK